MYTDELESLKERLALWRANKKYRCETIPEELVVAARNALKSHKISKIIAATGIEKERIIGRSKCTKSSPTTLPDKVPSYTKLAHETFRLPINQPLVEIESIQGAKIRLFSVTEDVKTLVLSLCRTGV